MVFVQNLLKKSTNYCKAELNQILKKIKQKNVQLHSQESQECNWVFNIGVRLKIDMVMAITTQTIK